MRPQPSVLGHRPQWFSLRVPETVKCHCFGGTRLGRGVRCNTAGRCVPGCGTGVYYQGGITRVVPRVVPSGRCLCRALALRNLIISPVRPCTPVMPVTLLNARHCLAGAGMTPRANSFPECRQKVVIKARHSPCCSFMNEKACSSDSRILLRPRLLSIGMVYPVLGPGSGNQSKSQSVP